jgi:hypothetical protein
MAALCGALAAFAAGCLKTVDKVRDHFQATDGVRLPSGEKVLKVVMVKMASDDSES